MVAKIELHSNSHALELSKVYYFVSEKEKVKFIIFFQKRQIVRLVQIKF